MSHWLGDTTAPGEQFTKIARLHELAALGLPVPRGLVLERPELSARDAHEVSSLLAQGPVIVRSAHRGEDGARSSMAGLGTSVPDCPDLEAVRAALREIEHQRVRALADQPQVLVQAQVQRAWLLVGVWTAEGDAYLEAHDAPGAVLANGSTPRFAGLLERWPHHARDAVTALGESVNGHVRGAFGLDLEIVVDPEDRPWLVQVRPLAAPLHPGWAAFSDAMQEQRRDDPTPPSLAGPLTLDAEHNPAPLSPAHAWLMRWLGAQRPGAADPVVLAGWLYVRTLPRALVGQSQAVDVHAVLERLCTVHLPRARSVHEAIGREIGSAPLAALEPALDRALAAFLDMIDVYLRELVPARRAAARVAHAGGNRHAPLTLRDRERYMDVLPAAWDLASSTLGELLPASAPSVPSTMPLDDPDAAALLGEWDDHLFALGLAPLRAVYLRAGACLGVLPPRMFMLDADQLRTIVRDGPAPDLADTLDARERAWAAQARLRPPLRLWDGRPLPAASGAWLRGIPIGESFEGVLAQRSSLAELVAAPPSEDAIVCMPALTAPAAVVLRHANVRAVCTEHGGALGHGALMCREFGLSALVGCRGCTSLPDGARARLDARTGRLSLLGGGAR